MRIFLLLLSLFIVGPAFAETPVTITIDASLVLPNTSVFPQSWPPSVTVSSLGAGGLQCAVGAGGETSVTVDGYAACTHTVKEGAAGTTYLGTTYVIARNNEEVTISWTLRQSNCGNYDEPKRSECSAEQAAFFKDYSSLNVAREVLRALSSAATTFRDVPANHANAQAIAYVKARGIVEGYPDGTYRPDQIVNRAEFTKIIVGSLYSRSEINDCTVQGDAPLFSDVVVGAWYVGAVCTAHLHELIGGYSDGTFRPADSINFVEAAKILVQAFDPPSRFEITADAEDTSPWYRAAVTALGENHAIPLSIGSFNQKMTRGEMAEMIYRLDGNITDKASRTYEALAADAGAEYIVRYYYESKPTSPEPYDAEIILRNSETGHETVLISSVKKALPELQQPINRTLRLFAKPAGGNVLILKSVLADTDNASGTLYALNLTTRTFSPLALSAVFDGFYDGSAISPDQRRVVWTAQPIEEKWHQGIVQSLYVGSLNDDSYAPIVTLSGNETFDNGGYALSSIYDITWVDDTTVRYAVFDQTKKGGDPIEYRTVRIP